MSPEEPSVRQLLEERITHCEHLADALNRVVTDLQTRVLALEKQNRQLAAELRKRQEAERELGWEGERPPHY